MNKVTWPRKPISAPPLGFLRLTRKCSSSSGTSSSIIFTAMSSSPTPGWKNSSPELRIRDGNINEHQYLKELEKDIKYNSTKNNLKYRNQTIFLCYYSLLNNSNILGDEVRLIGHRSQLIYDRVWFSSGYDETLGGIEWWNRKIQELLCRRRFEHFSKLPQIWPPWMQGRTI